MATKRIKRRVVGAKPRKGIRSAKAKKAKISTQPKLGTSRQHPRPFPHLVPKAKMRPRETGWVCRECELVIAIDLDAPLSARIPDAYFVEVTCPHCETTDVHTWAARAELPYEQPASTPDQEETGP
jgi:hypothetical protein